MRINRNNSVCWRSDVGRYCRIEKVERMCIECRRRYSIRSYYQYHRIDNRVYHQGSFCRTVEPKARCLYFCQLECF